MKKVISCSFLKNMTRTVVMHLQAKIWQELLWCTCKQKYGKNYCDAPSMTVCHCLLKRDAQDSLFRMLIYSFSFRDGLVGFSRNPRLIGVLINPTTFACGFLRLQLTRFVSFNVNFIPAVRKAADKNQRTTDDDWLRCHVWRRTSTAK